MEKNLVKAAYKKLHLISPNMERVKISTINEYLTTLRKKSTTKSNILSHIVLCNEKFPDLTALNIGKNFSAAIIGSGAGLPASLVENIRKQKNFSLIGAQKYLFPPQKEALLNSAGFGTIHLGEFRDNMASVEPLLRNVKYVFLDMTSVKHSDYPWEGNTNPNGFFANEICQIARFIGFSCDLKAVFVYGLPKSKCPQVCANLAAQVAWHIADAVANNIKEDPAKERKKGKLPNQFEHRIIDFCSHGDTLTFITSVATGRWWIEVPIIKKNTTELMPCTEEDYHTAAEGQVPMRWLYYYNKLNNL